MDKQHRSITNDLYGANVLLAPNGNPSNLSPQQYMLVRTPEFKEWFGDWERLAMAKVKDPAMDEVTLANLSKDVSKVVDQNGEPLVVYHLTREDFNIFEYRGYSQGFFFTPYKDSDFNYRGSKIITAFLNIKTLSELSNIPEGKWSVPMFENRFIEQAQLDKEYQSQKTWDDTIFKGYPNSDGIKFIRDNGEEIIVAFEPNQIKLADGTNTTFDGSNPDIRFDDGGMTYRQYLDTQFDENEDRYLPSGYLQFEIKQADRSKYPILFIEKNGLEYRIKNNNDSVIVVFDNEKQVAYADNKAIMVAPTYQKRGIGLELVRILKERNPNHRFGSMTPEGFNLLGKYYDTYIAKNPDIRFDNGGELDKINSMNQLSFARGGKIIVDKNDKQKFAKIGIDDKYDIEAIKDIGLQGLNFTNEVILNKIEEEFKNLLNNYRDYVISEDSDAITKTIENTIQTMKLEGRPQSDINVYENALTNDRDRKKYIDDFASNQEATLSNWVSYLEQSEYRVSFKYLLLKAVLKFNYDYKIDKLIERNNKTIRNFTPFDASVIGQLVVDNSDYLLKDYTTIQVKNAFNILNSKETIKQSGNGRWVKFNGGSGVDAKEIEKNANELSQLVQNTYWCTKTNAYSQLEAGDFYVYVTEKDNELFPRIAIRMEEDEVGEVRGNKSQAQDIEEEMLPIAEDFLINNIPNDSGKEWLDSIDYNKRVVDFSKRLEKDGLVKGDFKVFLELIKQEWHFNKDYGGENSNIRYLKGVFKECVEGERFSKDFEYPNKDYFDFYGGNSKNNHLYKVSFVNIQDYTENRYPNLEIALEYVRCKKEIYLEREEAGTGKLKYIGGDLSIFNGEFMIKSLGNIEYVGGACRIDGYVEDLGNLEEVGMLFIFPKSQIKSLGKLKKAGTLEIHESTSIMDLGQVEYVESLMISSDNIKTLGNKIVKIKSELNLFNSAIEDLGSLEVCGDVELQGNRTLESLGKLRKVGALDLHGSNVMSLGNVEQITATLYLNKHIKDFGKVQEVWSIDFRESKIKSLGNIKKVKYLDLSGTMIEDLGDLEEVTGYLQLNSKIKSLGKLKRVDDDLTIPNDSKIQSLDNLEYVGGNLEIETKSIKSLGNLKQVKGKIRLLDANIEDLGSLVQVEGHLYLDDCKKLKTLGKLNKVGGRLDLRGCKNLESFGDLEYCGDIRGLSSCKKITTLGNLKSVDDLDLYEANVTSLDGVKYIKSLSIDTPIDLSTIPIIQELTINPFYDRQKKNFKNISLNKISTLNLYNLSLESLYVNEVDTLILANTQIKTLSDAKGLKLLEFENDSVIANFDNVNLKEMTQFKTRSYSDKSLQRRVIAIVKKAKQEYINQGEIVYQNIEKYNMLINNLKSLLSKPDISIEDKKEIREAVEAYEDFISEMAKEIENRLEYGGKLFDNGGNVKKIKFDIESIEGEEDRTTISIKDIGEVVLVETFPEYEFLDDVDEQTLEELGVQEGDLIGKIEHIEIKDEYKGKGYAKLLMKKAIEVAKEKGLIPLYLNASPMGYKGLNINDLTNFYEGFGFKVFLEQGNNNLMILNDTNIKLENGGQLFDNGGNMKKVDSGGITYGASHDNGGIPVKNASTGEMLEVEGGEGIVNKRSMASDKIVKLNGEEMTICEAVSQLNQIEGGVKFSCDDVEHRQFIEEMEYGGELERGERTEMEHIKVLKDLYAKRITPKQATKQIAKDHIKENPNYYTELSKIEKKMDDGGKSDCGCSHHTTTKFSQGGQSDCGCGQNRFDNGGFVRGKGTIEDLIRSKSKQGDKTKEVITDTIIEARNLLDVDYLPIIKKNNFEFYNKYCVGFSHLNLYKMGWRFQFGTSREWAGLCDSRDRVEITRANLSKNKNLYVSINFVKHDANWSKNSKDVILHEIAHALVTEVFEKKMSQGALQNLDPKHFLLEGHGELWAKMCKAINQDGTCSRFYANALLQESFKSYMYNCANCRTQRYSNSSTFTKNCFKCGSPVLVVKSKI